MTPMCLWRVCHEIKKYSFVKLNFSACGGQKSKYVEVWATLWESHCKPGLMRNLDSRHQVCQTSPGCQRARSTCRTSNVNDLRLGRSAGCTGSAPQWGIQHLWRSSRRTGCGVQGTAIYAQHSLHDWLNMETCVLRDKSRGVRGLLEIGKKG